MATSPIETSGQQFAAARIDTKDSNAVRFVTFNVNGIKTLYSYYPWTNCLNNLDNVLHHIDGDIVTLQELKLSQIEKLLSSNYWSFVSLPKYKKGYSGVGLFVKKSLGVPVVKAEEGITGHLRLSGGGKKFRERPQQCCIGAYPLVLDDDRYLELDNEGRCIMVELANGCVVIAVYCPANSMGTEEGEKFRMEYLTCLFERCHALIQLGKLVVLMGDINVCLDLIDHAESLSMTVKNNNSKIDSPTFELDFLQPCLEFKSSTKARELLNNYVIPAPQFQAHYSKPTQCLFDTTRVHIGRKRNVYTVWNTLTGARQLNYGSRIDLILSSLASWPISNAGIWPFLMGSDHCPVFTDFEWPQASYTQDNNNKSWLDVEMNKYYNISRHQDITSLFGSRKRVAPTTTISTETVDTQQKRSKLVYVSRKKQNGTQLSIGSFLSKSDTPSKATTSSSSSSSSSMTNDIPFIQSSPLFVGTTEGEAKTTINSITKISDALLGKPPNCNHGLSCQLRTSLSNPKTRGKKFWCCPKKVRNVLNSSQLGEYQCSFFQWVSK